MRGAVGALIIAAAGALWMGFAGGDAGRVYGQRPAAGGPNVLSGSSARAAQAGDLAVLAEDTADGRFQQLVLVDARSRVVSVYHVDRSSGQVALKSVRNVMWDLQIDEFNGEQPSPQTIRTMLPQR